jgi:hypothetical protein
MQKEKSRKFCIYTVKMAATSSLVILFALVIHTAPTVLLKCNEIVTSSLKKLLGYVAEPFLRYIL